MSNNEEYNLEKNTEILTINNFSPEVKYIEKKKKMNLVAFTKKIFQFKNVLVREFLGEIISTFLLIAFGCASVAQFVLGKSKFGTFVSVNLSWGLAVTMGILISGKVSGAHMNPAVSLSALISGKISLVKFFVYVVGQSIGAFLGSVLVFIVYLDALYSFDGGVRAVTGTNATAGIWATYPSNDLSIIGGFLDQFFGTALLVLVVSAVSDQKNAEIPHGIVALLLGSTVFLIGMTFGMNCGYAINPVRDFIPRLFTCIAGWGSEVFTANRYFFWIPIVGPFAGSIFSTFLYALMIGNHFPDELKN